MPDESFLKEVAAQLRKPSGEFGNEVAYAMNKSNELMNLATIKALQIEDGNTILEIGMGNGFFVPHVLKQAGELTYVGVDYSDDMVQLASSVNKTHVEQQAAKFYVGAAHELPFDDQIIDRLFTVNTVYFWDNPSAILKEFKRVLKPGGLLAVAIRPEQCLKQYPSTKYNFEFISNEKILNWLQEHHFEIDEVIEETEAEVEILEKRIIPKFTVFIAKAT